MSVELSMETKRANDYHFPPSSVLMCFFISYEMQIIGHLRLDIRLLQT